MHAAQAAGEVANESDPPTLARMATSFMLALSIRTRTGTSRRSLTKLARDFVDLLAPAERGETKAGLRRNSPRLRGVRV